MANKYPCIETTVDFRLGYYYDLRLWINKQELPENYDYEEEIIKQIEKYYYDTQSTASKNEILEFVGKLPNINAVQIQEQNGIYKNGTVIYTVDFADDLHG